MSQTEADALVQCAAEADKLLGKTSSDTTTSFIQLINDLADEFHNKFLPIQRSLLVEERRCVLGAGWEPVNAVDVDRVDDVGPAQLFGVNTAAASTDPNTGAETYTPLPREIDLALAFVQCRNRLSVPQRGLEVAKRIQGEVIRKNDARISQLNTNIAKASRNAQKVLS